MSVHHGGGNGNPRPEGNAEGVGWQDSVAEHRQTVEEARGAGEHGSVPGTWGNYQPPAPIDGFVFRLGSRASRAAGWGRHGG